MSEPGYFEHEGWEYHWEKSGGFCRLARRGNGFDWHGTGIPAGAVTEAMEALEELRAAGEEEAVEWVWLWTDPAHSRIRYEATRDGSRVRAVNAVLTNGTEELHDDNPYLRIYRAGLRIGRKDACEELAAEIDGLELERDLLIAERDALKEALEAASKVQPGEVVVSEEWYQAANSFINTYRRSYQEPRGMKIDINNRYIWPCCKSPIKNGHHSFCFLWDLDYAMKAVERAEAEEADDAS